jgi:superfamily II DNA or RNA helicase
MSDQLDLFGRSYGPKFWKGIQPRRWQVDALPRALECIDAGGRGIVSAVMGSGKSVFLSEVLVQRPAPDGQVNVVTTPTVRLTEQIAATLRSRALDCGMYYTHAKDIRPVTVCCQASVGALCDELAARGLGVHLWIADEAHRSEAATMLEAHQRLSPAAALGCTATPFLADEKGRLSLWDRIVYQYVAASAFADGVIVKPELVLWDGPEAPLDEVCVAMIRKALWAGPGIVNAMSIEDAERFRDTLGAAGIRAAAVHSRNGPGVSDAYIEQLRTGQLHAIVHVDMLSEGVDLPWLRWLCMRRPVQSRVRFCQEVGRVLRSAPGKNSAQLLDPHDLFDSFGLTYEAMLGTALRRTREVQRTELEQLAAELVEQLRQPVDGKMRTLIASAIDQQRAYVRRLYLAFVAAGAIEQKIRSTHWRKDDPTDNQLRYAIKATSAMGRDTAVPLAHRKAFRLVGEGAAKLRKGDVSDLLSVAFALRDRRRDGLPWPLVENEE